MVDLQKQVKEVMLVLVEVQACLQNEDNLMHEVLVKIRYVQCVICLFSF